MRRFVSLFLALVILSMSIFTLSSCQRDREYDEAEVLSAARELIEKSVLLNEIYYGKGIPATTDSSTANGYYFEADIRYLLENDFKTVEDLKKMTAAVFTEDLCNLIFSTKLSSVIDEDNIQSMSRYYQKYYDAEGKKPECIMVYTKAIDLLGESEILYDYTTLAVDGVKGEYVTVSIDATVYNGKGDYQSATLKIRMLEEESGWRLDSPTYKVYSERLDEYEDLTKK